MDHLQALVDGMSAQWQKERSASQLTLGALIKQLESMAPDASVRSIRHPHSYRGYYSDLAFESGAGVRPAGELLAECRRCMGEVFEGYKGGDYQMGALTPLWIADYGCCGEKLMSLDPATGSFTTAPDA